MKRIAAIIIAACLCIACAALAEEKKPEQASPQVTEAQVERVIRYAEDMVQLRTYQYKEAIEALKEARAQRAQLQKQEPKK